MATNTNTDLTEEDAADLQFPKGKSRLYSLFIHESTLDNYLQKIHPYYPKI